VEKNYIEKHEEKYRIVVPIYKKLLTKTYEFDHR
jgi:hypothetical protein